MVGIMNRQNGEYEQEPQILKLSCYSDIIVRYSAIYYFLVVVRQAMLQNSDPEIQAKLAAMQRQMALKKAEHAVKPQVACSPGTVSIVSGSEASRPKPKVLTAEQREEQSR